MMVPRDEIRNNAKRIDAVFGEAPDARSAANMAAVARRAVDGVVDFNLNGVHATRVGRRQIDWSAPQHQHQEWPAQLNRFFFLGPLAEMYGETGDESYADAARDFIEDWLRAHPSRPSWVKAPYDNTLNLSIRVGHLRNRMGGWCGCLPRFLDSPRFDDAFVSSILESVRCQLAFLMVNMPLGINWRIAAADCLIASGLRLAFLPEAKGWREFGVRVINDAYHRQILPDGAHYERNPGYHTWMTMVMGSYWQLGQAMPELGLIMRAERVAAMWDYALACTRPNGQFNGMHDCQGARSGPYGNAHGRAVRDDRADFQRRAGLPEMLPAPSLCFPDAGQALLRTGWDEDAAYVAFDATLWGGSHCHLSRNGLQLHARRRTLLADPGTYTYERRDPFSAYGKSTRAHNTCTLNGLNQCEANPTHTTFLSGPGYDLVRSDYEGGYWEGDYTWGFSHLANGIMGNHCRIMFWIHDLGVVVLDSMYRTPRRAPEREEDIPAFECYWHFCEGGKVAVEPGRAVVRYPDSGLAVLFAHLPEGTAVTAHEGEKEPLRGWMPTPEGIVPAPEVMVRLARMARMHEEMLTVLVPFGAGALPTLRPSVWKSEADRFGRLTLNHPDGATDEVHWSYRLDIMLGQTAEFATDAALVHLRKDRSGRVVKACAVGGTYFDPFDRAVRASPGVIVWEAAGR